MNDQTTKYHSTTLEIIVAGGEMRLRIDGVSRSQTTRFAIDDATIKAIKKGYMDLASASQIGTYRRHESKLGRQLAEILLGPPGKEPADGLAGNLHRCMNEANGKYVRLLLSFDEARYAELPWEMALWQRPETGEEIYLGHDPRLALTRVEHDRAGHDAPTTTSNHLFGKDRVLSILHVSADDSKVGEEHYEFMRGFFRTIDEYIPGLHTASRRYKELRRYYQQSKELTGQRPEFDIVHWRGHGSASALSVPSGNGRYKFLSPAELLKLTPDIYLYVLLTCESSSSLPDKQTTALEQLEEGVRLSAALLADGAPLVLGIYYLVKQTEFEHLPILYVLLFRGLPVDYCVQSVRRFFAQSNAKADALPLSQWQKLILHTKREQYLDLPTGSQPVKLPRDAASTEAEVYGSFEAFIKPSV